MNQSSGMNESLRYRYLDELQDKTNLTLIPVFIYLFLLLFLGLLGNSLILVVYLKKQRKTATIILILSIALLDLITNIVIIPATLYDFFHTWNYHHATLCKSYLYLNNFMASASAILLLAVAVVRYRKICNPFKKQVTAKQAKIISAAIILISLVWSIPYGITHGRQTKTTPNKNITGFHCSIDDDFVGTIWPEVVNGFAIVVFLACGIPLSAMYVFIGIQAWKHSQIYGMRTSSRRRHAAQAKIKNNVVEPGLKNEDKTEEKSTSTDEDEEEETEETKEQNRTQETIDLSLTKENKNETSSVSGITATQSKTGNAVTDLPTNRNRRHVNGKTTLMLFAISAVYVVTNLTTLCLVLVRAVKTDYINSLGMVADSFYKLFMLSYLLNCAVNPIIYSMCDKHFRQQCLYILSYLRCC